MDNWAFVVASVIVPFATGLLKKWSVANEMKAAVAFVVAIVLAAAGMLIQGTIEWGELPKNALVIFGAGTVIYRTMKFAKEEKT